jgi:hypothetical protein
MIPTQTSEPGRGRAEDLTAEHREEVDIIRRSGDHLPEELRRATPMLDREALAAVIERIAATAPDTARGLMELVENFRVGRVRDLLEDVP